MVLTETQTYIVYRCPTAERIIEKTDDFPLGSRSTLGYAGGVIQALLDRIARRVRRGHRLRPSWMTGDLGTGR